jgi:hypothetical protein
MSPLFRTTAPFPEDVSGLTRAVSASSAGDAQKIAVALIELQVRAYNAISRQGAILLRWALVAALLGVAFLGAAPFVLLPRGGPDTARYILICGEIIEGFAALLLVFFGIDLLRLAACQHQLSRLERFTLANNLCQALPEESRPQAYAEQAGRLSGGPSVSDVLGELTAALDRMVARSRRAVPAQPAAPAGPASGWPTDAANPEAAAREEAASIQHLTP